MTARDIAKLPQLQQIAQIRSERELKKFAAFARAMQAQHQTVSAAETALGQSYDSAAPLSVPVARIANAQAGRAARDMQRAQQELARMTPRFEQARSMAAREFGRAQVLSDLAKKSALARGNSD